MTQPDLFSDLPEWPSWIPPEAFTNNGDSFNVKAWGIPVEDWIVFDEWRHTPNGREVSNLVVRYSLQMKRRGWNTFAIESVVNKIRWEQALKHGPDVDGYRINNNWKKRLAIWAMTRSEDLKGFFRLREQGSKKGIDDVSDLL